MAGLLTYPDFWLPSHPFLERIVVINQKHTIPREAESGFTAAGTVPDSHRLPKLSPLGHQFSAKIGN